MLEKFIKDVWNTGINLIVDCSIKLNLTHQKIKVSKIFHVSWNILNEQWTANFDLCSALMVIEQWGFFSVPHQLWHGASICNSHFRGPETLAHVAESLAVELSLPVFMTSVCHRWDSNTQPSASETNAQTDCATTAVRSLLKVKLLSLSHFRN